MAAPWEADAVVGAPSSAAPASAAPASGAAPWESDAVVGAPAPATSRQPAADKPLTSSTGEALGLGAVQGATMNFGDELAGLHAAAGKNGGWLDTAQTVLEAPMGGLPTLIRGGVNMAADYLTGAGKPPEGQEGPAQPGAIDRYAAARDAFRARYKTVEQERPGAALAGNVAGGFAVPLARAGQGVTALGRAVYGLVNGAIQGGVAGVGAGETAGDRAVGGIVGGGVGGLLGAAASPVMDVLSAGARWATRPVRDYFNKAVRPDIAAERVVGRSMEADRAIDPNATARMTDAEFAANSAANGGPALNVDRGGDTVRRVADWANTVSPTAGRIMREPLDARNAAQGDRLNGWFNDLYGFPNAEAQRVALEAERSTVNRTRYPRAYADGDRSLWSPELERLAGAPDVVDAIKDAVTKGKSWAVADGHGAFNPGVMVENGVLRFNRGPTGVPTYPNLQFWDYAKRSLDNKIGVAQRSGAGDDVARLTRIKNLLTRELDVQVPAYAEARAGHAFFAGAENALEAGQNFVGQGKRLGLDAARTQVARMTDDQRRLFQDGYVSRFMEKAGNVKDRHDLFGKILQSPQERAEMAIAIGPQRAAELEAMVHLENLMSMPRAMINGNSQTARRLYDLGIGGGAGIASVGAMYNQDPTTMTLGGVVAALSAGGRAADTRLAERVARLLMSGEPSRMEAAVRLAARSQAMLERLRDNSAAMVRRTGAPQGHNFVGPQAGATAGAEEDNKRVPRPPQK